MIKQKIIKNKNISWLFEDLSQTNAIIHSDIDGLLTMGFLQNYAGLKEIVGIYDLRTFHMKEEKYKTRKEFRKMVGLDLDISYFDIRNIGHHMTCVKSNEKSLNINDLYGLQEDLVNNYYRKYPLNTVILLYSLFNIKPKTDEEIALLVYADSVFGNYTDKYKKNVTYWLKILNQYEILDALENRCSTIQNIIDNQILPITSKIKDPRASSKYSQCPLTQSVYIQAKGKCIDIYNGNPKIILDLIRRITNWNIIDLPKQLLFTRECYVNTICLSKDKKNKDEIQAHLKKLKKFLLENKSDIVSSSMPYINSFRITTNSSDKKIVLKDNQYVYN